MSKVFDEALSKRFQQIKNGNYKSKAPEKETELKTNYEVRKYIKEGNSDKINVNTIYKFLSVFSDITIKNFPIDAVRHNLFQEYIVRTWLDSYDFMDIAKGTPHTNKTFVLKRDNAEAQSNYNKRIDTIDDELRKKRENEHLSIISETIQCYLLKHCNKMADVDLVDYQCTLGSSKTRDGAVDIVGFNDGKMELIEYKKPESKEPLLRAVVEIITYYHKMDGTNPNSAYYKKFNKVFGKNVSSSKLAVVVPEVRYKAGHRRAFELVEKYDIDCYTFTTDRIKEVDELYTSIRKIDKEELSKLKAEAYKNTKEVYENSDIIIDTFNKLYD